jgi:hypothetical protein
MKVRHNIASGIQTIYRRLLVAVDLQAADVIAHRAEREREV